MIEHPAVVPCTTSDSGVLVRTVFPVPFEFPVPFHLRSSSEFTRVPDHPAVVLCTTSSSGVFVKECISGSFRIEVLPVRLRLLPFRTTIFNLRNNLFYDDFI